MARISQCENVGQLQREGVAWTSSWWRRSATTPKVRPQRKYGPLLWGGGVARNSQSRPRVWAMPEKIFVGFLGVGMKPGAELQNRLSEGARTVELKRSWPVVILIRFFIKGPLWVFRRSETSARSVDLKAVESRPLIGTQCVEWTSVGCSVKGGKS